MKIKHLLLVLLPCFLAAVARLWPARQLHIRTTCTNCASRRREYDKGQGRHGRPPSRCGKPPALDVELNSSAFIRCFIVLTVGFFLASIGAQATQPFGLVPKPVSVAPLDGEFSLMAGTPILFSQGCEGEAESLSQRLKSLAGFGLAVSQAGPGRDAGPAILLRLDPASASTLGTEGYQLAVHKDGIVISAPATAGLFYGGITLAQLAYPAAQSGSGVSIPCVEITDYPRFAWRGIMLDCSRHFMPKESI